jgi:YHS domain-containing protein
LFVAAGCEKKTEPAKPGTTTSGIKLPPQAPPPVSDAKPEAKPESKPEEKAEPKPSGKMNDICPVTGDTADPKFTAAYQGRTIAFCCEHCLREFRDADEKGKAEIAAKVK